MVNDEGQLYTIEGIAAAALILTTVYLVLNSTMAFTPGDTHVYDMQLEQLGNDVLAVMDQPHTWDTAIGPNTKSPLERYIESNRPCEFYRDFRLYSRTTTGTEIDNIHLKANISYYDGFTVHSIPFKPDSSTCSEPIDEYYRENAVVVTRWVNIDNRGATSLPELNTPQNTRQQTVLLEVLLWRG